MKIYEAGPPIMYGNEAAAANVEWERCTYISSLHAMPLALAQEQVS